MENGGRPGWPGGREEEEYPLSSAYVEWILIISWPQAVVSVRIAEWITSVITIDPVVCAVPPSQRLELRLTGKGGTTTFDIAVYRSIRVSSKTRPKFPNISTSKVHELVLFQNSSTRFVFVSRILFNATLERSKNRRWIFLISARNNSWKRNFSSSPFLSSFPPNSKIII